MGYNVQVYEVGRVSRKVCLTAKIAIKDRDRVRKVCLTAKIAIKDRDKVW